MTFLHPTPVLNIWLAARGKTKLKYLPSFIIRSDPIWKTVQVMKAVAATGEALVATAVEGDLEETDLAVRGRSGHRLCE
jgi:hypothetical protein